MKISRFLSLLVLSAGVATAVDFPGKEPGPAQLTQTEQRFELSNDLFTATFEQGAKGMRFMGMKLANGKPVAEASPNLFTVKLASGAEISSANMTMSGVATKNLPAKPKALRLNQRVPGKSITATFTAPDDSFSIKWSAVLRDGSSYLRQEFSIKAKQDVAFRSLTPLNYNMSANGDLTISGNTTHGTLAINGVAFTGLETPMGLITLGGESSNGLAWNPETWDTDGFGPVFNIPDSLTKAYGNKYSKMDGPVAVQLRVSEGSVEFTQAGDCTVAFQAAEAQQNPLHPIAVQLVSADGATVVSEDVHEGRVGHKVADKASYQLKVPAAGLYTLRYWVQTAENPVAGQGRVSLSLAHAGGSNSTKSETPANLVTGTWNRATTLKAGQKWQVSTVLGLFGKEQQRRSFLYYSERERAVPYRPFVHYNDWYEIGIRLHDNQDPAKRTNEKMWLDIVNTWNRELFTKRNTHLDAFVIDDGWDEFNSLWDFHCGFPQGFKNIGKLAHKQKAGIGTWLGPVGGYGSSKKMRLNNWNKAHANRPINNFQLSNDEYFTAFTGRCKQMIKDYDMRYFKFDGISTKFHAKGPAGEEDAEGILKVLTDLREARPDVFINTTVGTWASPFWFRFADSIWRQENDFGQVGGGDARDQWITYRDRLVHEVFVEGAPLCPINSLMTHGIIITKNGPPRVMSTDPANCVKEIRAAFGCGSGLLEIYADQDLLNQGKGELWDELATGIKWLRRNKDVLADTHWVGGNPWNGSDGDIYGWAAWNKSKSTLTLRNSSGAEKTLKTTLRKILDVPPGVRGKVQFRNSYPDQRELPGFTGKSLSYDEEISLTLKPFEVFVFEGKTEGKGK